MEEDSKRVLLVEDEALIAMDLEQLLTGLGLNVVGPFKRNRDALRALESETVDFAVLDYLLGDGSSDSVADRLRQLGVPYIFLTGCDEALVGGSRHDAPTLLKPVSHHQMTEALREARAPVGATVCHG